MDSSLTPSRLDKSLCPAPKDLELPKPQGHDKKTHRSKDLTVPDSIPEITLPVVLSRSRDGVPVRNLNHWQYRLNPYGPVSPEPSYIVCTSRQNLAHSRESGERCFSGVYLLHLCSPGSAISPAVGTVTYRADLDPTRR